MRRIPLLLVACGLLFTIATTGCQKQPTVAAKSSPPKTASAAPTHFTDGPKRSVNPPSDGIRDDEVYVEEFEEELLPQETEVVIDEGQRDAPKHDLLCTVGPFYGSGLEGRGSSESRKAMVRAYGGNAVHDSRALPREGLPDELAMPASSLEAAPIGLDFDPLGDMAAPGEGRGPGESGDKFDRIYENEFKEVKNEPLSTFSIDVDTASYSRVRSYLMEYNQLPPADAVRIEELVNYFPYDYVAPMSEHPFSALMEVTQCPWQPEHRLARIAIKGQEIQQDARPASNLVFLLDVSGSMNDANKLPLVKKGLQLLTSQLNKNDRVAIVVYAGAAGLVLPSTTGDQHKAIIDALEALESGGSTNGGEGINLAYKTAEENFITAGTNRVILCSDGDFNVGVTSTAELVRLAEEFAKKNIFLSVLGFGTGNLNDSLMEQLSGKANGNYAFIDTESEAKKVLVEQMEGTLVTIAKDVKIRVEFNPTKVKAYRLIGYENRILAAEDFNNDKKDAGEIGAGHTVTALYEIVPSEAETKLETGKVDDLKYQKDRELTGAAASDELLTLKLRYKQPEGDKSTLLLFPIDDATEKFGAASPDFKFAAAVASFGMLLRGSAHKGSTSYDAVLEIASDSAKGDMTDYRTEFLELVKKAKALSKK